jgi:hypothetical protein
MPDPHCESPEFITPPATPAALHDWIQNHLGTWIVQRAQLDLHTPPFAYICHTFFEGAGRWPPAPAAPADPPLDCIVWANRGGGKTFLGALATALDLIFKPGIQVRILGGSLEQSMRMHEHLRAIFQRPPFDSLIHGNITDKRIRLINRSAVQLLAQSQTSVRGTRVQKLRCDEVDLFTPRVWEAAQLTTRSATLEGIHVRGTIEALSTMHEPYGIMQSLVQEAREGRRRLFKWGLVDVLQRCDDRYHCQAHPEHQPSPCPLLAECGGALKSRDSCEGHISIDDALRQKARVPRVIWEAEMLCLRPLRTNTVFPEFDAARHIVAHDPPRDQVRRWIGGMDFGFRSPTAILWAALDRAGRLWILGERIVAGALLREHIDAIHAAPWPTLEWIAIDPAGAQRNDQTGRSNAAAMREAGLRIRMPRMMIRDGLLLIRARLQPADNSPPRLLFHQRCAQLIRAMEQYHYDPARPDNETPVKDGPDHPIDALRYLIATLDRPHDAKLEPY